MPDMVDAIMGRITRAVLASHRQLQRDVVADIRHELATPYPPASAPGDDPHKRTGDLQRGITGETVSADDVITTQVTSSRVSGNPLVPFFLNFGTKKMRARPYMFLVASRWAKAAPLRIAISTRANLSASNSTAAPTPTESSSTP